MITNRQIHDMAEKGYAKRRADYLNGIQHRIGYVVRWDCRNASDGSPKFCVFGGVVSTVDVESDCAGHLNKSDAQAIARKIVKDGYQRVRVIKVKDNNGCELDEDVKF